MEKAVIIGTNQRVTPEDYNNFNEFPRQTIDHVVHDLGLDDKGFVGFNVVGQTGAGKVTVGAGRYYRGSDDGTPVFFNADQGGVELSFLALLPVTTMRIITVGVTGREFDTDGDPRTFLTNVDTRATTSRLTNTTSTRRAEINAYAGDEKAEPVAKVLPSDALAVAYILCGPQGIVSITSAEQNRLPSVRGNARSILDINTWRKAAGSRLDTLGSDLASLGAKIKGLASEVFVREVAGDTARLKELAKLPSAYSSYDSDSYLTPDKSNFNHVDMLSTVMEGIRFPPANSNDSQIGLLNALDSKVINQNFFVLPRYTEAARLQMLDYDAEVSISQYQFQNTNIVQKTRSATRVRYGTPFTVCTNNADWWKDATIDYANWTIYKGGATYAINSQIANVPNHELWRIQLVWTDQFEEAYWDYNTTTDTASGSILAQTYLNAQDGWLTSIDLMFTKVAATGDVTVLITETTAAAPDVTKVISRSKVTVADMKTAPKKTNIPIPPTLWRKGVRYAIHLVTPGNHFLGVTTDNKLGQGSMFINSDGAFQVGDLTRDFAMGLNFAKFKSPYVEVDLNPLQLAGGIAGIDLQTPSAVPAGTQLVFSVQDPANGVWKPLSPDSAGKALLGLPPLVRFKAIFIGTTDLMPGFGVGTDARVVTTRPRPDARHISTKRTLPAAAKNFTIKVRLESWRGGTIHTHALKIATGALINTGVGDTIVSPASVSEAPAQDDKLNAIERTYTFSLGTAVSAFIIRQDLTTTNVLSTFHVASKIDIETP